MFNKTNLLSHLQTRADAIQTKQQFNRNGTSQLWPQKVDELTKQLITRAVEYGRREALEDLIAAVNDKRL